MKKFSISIAVLLLPLVSKASEADLLIPDLTSRFFNGQIEGRHLLLYFSIIILFGLMFGVWQFARIKRLPVHRAMLEISETIYTTCKTYLLQQGRFLLILLVIISIIIFYYFFGLSGLSVGKVLIILLWTVLGILGSYSVAWFGIRINTLANSRTSFASLRQKPWNVLSIPLQAGMSVGLFLICIELIMMLIILLAVPGDSAGACFVGFAIGESLGASALRIAGGIFTKIADIGREKKKGRRCKK